MRIGLHSRDLLALQSEKNPPRLEPRPRLFGIGMGKTGTNALASLFSGLRAAHEAETGTLIEALLDYENQRCDWRSLADLIMERDRRLGLVVDVSNLNIFLVDLLVAMDPGAKFVLTLRDPYTWLDSILNHYLRSRPTAQWRDFAAHRFGNRHLPHPAEENSLRELGLHPLGGYLSYWRAHIEKALAAVPGERLLIVRMEDIASQVHRIAEFAGIPRENLDTANIREYRNPEKKPVLRNVSREYLEGQIALHCGPLVSRLFPEIRSAGDAGILWEIPPAPINEPLRAALLADPPRFHFWDGEWSAGGLGPDHLQLIEQTVADAGLSGGVAFETGAGLSTLWLLALGFREVHSFCIDPKVCERIGEFLRNHHGETNRWRPHIGPSELTLPPVAIAAAVELADFCLIDGGHSLDKVFVDFVYLNYLLKPGGVMAVDDLQLGSCRLLAEFLLQKNVGYSLVACAGKFAVFRKETDNRLAGDFGALRPLLDKLAACLGELPGGVPERMDRSSADIP